VRFTSRREAFSLRRDLTEAMSSWERAGRAAGHGSAEAVSAYRVQRTALARWQTFCLHHFGLSPPYASGWSELRRRVLAEEPECRSCGQPSQQVDHILLVSLGGLPRARSNLQALCQPCHSVKTALELDRLAEANWVIDPSLKPLDSDTWRQIEWSALQHRRREAVSRLFGDLRSVELLLTGAAALWVADRAAQGGVVQQRHPSPNFPITGVIDTDGKDQQKSPHLRVLKQ
jgi:5-methylcytosine-specific restriction endonuclease McrA